MRNLKSHLLSIIGSLILVLIIAFCISGTVASQNGHSREAVERYYDELERDYLTELKSMLAREGYKNSGVTMTRVIDEEGTRSYTVTIHHGLIDKLSVKEKELLSKACGEVLFADAECSFSHNFL